MIVEAFPGMVRSDMATSRAMDGQSTGERRCPPLLDDWRTGNGGVSLCTRDNAPAYLPGPASRKIHLGPAGLCFQACRFLRLGKVFVSRSPGLQVSRSPGLQVLRYAGFVS